MKDTETTKGKEIHKQTKHKGKKKEKEEEEKKSIFMLV